MFLCCEFIVKDVPCRPILFARLLGAMLAYMRSLGLYCWMAQRLKAAIITALSIVLEYQKI